MSGEIQECMNKKKRHNYDMLERRGCGSVCFNLTGDSFRIHLHRDLERAWNH